MGDPAYYLTFVEFLATASRIWKLQGVCFERGLQEVGLIQGNWVDMSSLVASSSSLKVGMEFDRPKGQGCHAPAGRGRAE